MSAHPAIAATATPCAPDSITRAAVARRSPLDALRPLPLTEHLRQLVHFTDRMPLSDMDSRTCDRLYDALAALLAESIEADHDEDRRIHGSPVGYGS